MQSTILDETYCRIILGDMEETWLGNTFLGLLIPLGKYGLEAICFLVCPPLGNMIRKQHSKTTVLHG